MACAQHQRTTLIRIDTVRKQGVATRRTCDEKGEILFSPGIDRKIPARCFFRALHRVAERTGVDGRPADDDRWSGNGLLDLGSHLERRTHGRQDGVETDPLKMGGGFHDETR